MGDLTVFVSVGRTSTPEQEEFVSAVEAHMVAHGIVPQALGRNYWSSKQPLAAIDELMAHCSGAAILAFERLRIVQAIEKRGSSAERQLADFALPTAWNQVEAAMAYTRGLPLLVLVDETLRTEGLLETGYDWYVKSVRLGAPLTTDKEFVGVFADWRARVAAFAATRGPAPVSSAANRMGRSPTEEASGPAPSFNRRRLRTLLEARFNEDDLRGLCFDLNVDYEVLAGTSKVTRIISLIAHCERLRRADELVDAVRALRPDESW